MRPPGSTTTRAVALVIALLSCACGRTAAHQSPDPLQPTPQQQGLLVDASADFEFCFCHHGFGPGFHGAVPVTISSASTGR